MVSDEDSGQVDLESMQTVNVSEKKKKMKKKKKKEKKEGKEKVDSKKKKKKSLSIFNQNHFCNSR